MCFSLNGNYLVINNLKFYFVWKLKNALKIIILQYFLLRKINKNIILIVNFFNFLQIYFFSILFFYNNYSNRVKMVFISEIFPLNSNNLRFSNLRRYIRKLTNNTENLFRQGI